MSNRLKDEYSPYLKQHANNPVEWYPWGDEAFDKAKKENKPVFLSIGYSSCHWCHVMEKESFENKETAKILNKHFVSIKVDREERPDIDKHFQGVYQLMNSRPGGWPGSFFLTHDLKPFYSATYIPDVPKYGMMSFSTLLETIIEKYRTEKNQLIEKADEILSFLNPDKKTIQATKLDLSIIERISSQAQQLFDNTYGGFNKAPKFPQASLLDLILDVYSITKDKETLKLITHTLENMSKGGLRDLVDGGFCRYSTDDEWLVPHFEKMTYDNALISSVYIKAFHKTNNKVFKKIAFETIDFMLTKMSKENLFYSASDADTAGIEGKYFVYSYDKIVSSFEKEGIPGEDQKDLLKIFNITKDGNFEGKNIIRLNDIKDTKHPYFKNAIQIFKKIRDKREYPSIDDKIITSWNAMMISTLFKASRVDKKYLEIANSSLDTLLDTMYINGELYHSTILGKKPKIKAFLEDYAYLADTLIEAYRTTLDEMHLITATKLANIAIEQYFNHGLWKFSRGEFETKETINDSSYPSSLAVMISVLYSISSLVDPVYKKFVFKTLEINSYDVMRQPLSTPKLSYMVIRYLKDDIIIKTKEKQALEHINDIDYLAHPFSMLKVDTNDGFMLCNSSSCFGHEKDFQSIQNIIQSR